VLWPKFEDQKVGMHLAITGAIRDEILKSDELGYYLLDFMKANYEKNILERYQLSAGLSNLDILKHIASTRGISNKEDVEEKAAEVLLNDFRSLRLGRITLDIL